MSIFYKEAVNLRLNLHSSNFAKKGETNIIFVKKGAA